MPYWDLISPSVEKFTTLLWYKADLNITFQRWKLHEQQRGVPGRNLCPQYPLSGEMFSATRPIYAQHKWGVKMPAPIWAAAFTAERFTGRVGIVYLLYKSFKHKDKLQCCISNVLWWISAYVLILAWFLIELTLLKAIKSDSMESSIKHIIKYYITVFDILHDFKIILQDRFQFLLRPTAKYVLCYDKSTNTRVRERYKCDGKCQKIFPFLSWEV